MYVYFLCCATTRPRTGILHTVAKLIRVAPWEASLSFWKHRDASGIECRQNVHRVLFSSRVMMCVHKAYIMFKYLNQFICVSRSSCDVHREPLCHRVCVCVCVCVWPLLLVSGLPEPLIPTRLYKVRGLDPCGCVFVYVCVLVCVCAQCAGVHVCFVCALYVRCV